MQLTDLLPLEEWMELEKEITEKTGLSTNVFGTDGVRITEFHYWPNRLCPAIKATDKGQSFICAVAHMNLAAMAAHRKEPVFEECDAALVKLVVPIIVEDEYIGAVGSCGLLLDDGEVDTFAVNKITELDEAEVEKLAQGIGAVSSSDLEELGQTIQKRLDGVIADYAGKAGK